MATLVYVAVAFVTGGRPLFDGFAPPAPYKWVNPPPEHAAGNQKPEPAERSVPLTADGNEATNASTTDAQIIVTLPAGALAAQPPDTTVLLKLVPLDAATLPGLPAPMKVVSNAYQVTMAYQPSGEPVSGIKTGPSIAMTAGARGTKLFYSPDGKAWQETASRPFGSTFGLTGPFAGPGYYVIAADPNATTTTAAMAGKSAGGGSGGAAGVVVGLIAAGLAGIGVGVLRSRRRQRQAKAAAAAKAKAKAQARAKSTKAVKAPPPRKKRR